MSFTRRNVAIRSATTRQSTTTVGSDAAPDLVTASVQSPGEKRVNAPTTRLLGLRPSPVDGRPTTSTGCLSLDGLLAGHAGMALGNSVVVEELGTTDYASTLLRYFAAEGVVQGHQIHVVGFPETWGRELPAALGPAHVGDAGEKAPPRTSERMKIAWRYERLGEFGAGNVRGRPSSAAGEHLAQADQPQEVFCHAFDLTKRLTFPKPDAIKYLSVERDGRNPFFSIQQALASALKSSSPDTVHRIVIPSLLSPLLYPPQASRPSNLLHFLHFLRAMLRTYSSRLCIMLSIPLTLYPRDTGLTRWVELLSDGVLELVPFPHAYDNDITASSLNTSGAATAREERPQGMLHVHRLPVFHERGGGGTGSAGVEDDLAFTVSRRKFVIKPFSLPPVGGDQDAQKGDTDPKGMPKKGDLEF